jgi:hypothetical protein
MYIYFILNGKPLPNPKELSLDLARSWISNKQELTCLCEAKVKHNIRKDPELLIAFSYTWVPSSKKQMKLDKFNLIGLDDADDYLALQVKIMNMSIKKRKDHVALVVADIKKAAEKDKENDEDVEELRNYRRMV